jgi:hypothetical protein
VKKMLVEEASQKQAGREEAEFPDGGEDGGGGSVWESKDDLQCGRAQQEASEGGIQQRAAACTTLKLSKLYLQEAQTKDHGGRDSMVMRPQEKMWILTGSQEDGPEDL